MTEFGGDYAMTPKEAASDCDIVFVCVGNDDDVRAVVLGDSGALAGMNKGGVLVDHTTASAGLARELSKKSASLNIGFLDAPVSGGQAGAAASLRCSASCAGLGFALATILTLILTLTLTQPLA